MPEAATKRLNWIRHESPIADLMAYYFPMSATEFRIGLAVIGHSQAAFGRMLELSPRTVRAWALEETPIPSYAAVILRLLVSKKITVEEVRYVLATPLAMR